MKAALHRNIALIICVHLRSSADAFRLQLLQPFCCFAQAVEGAAEGKSQVPVAVIARCVEVVAGHGGDTDFPGHVQGGIGCVHVA